MLQHRSRAWDVSGDGEVAGVTPGAGTYIIGHKESRNFRVDPAAAILWYG